MLSNINDILRLLDSYEPPAAWWGEMLFQWGVESEVLRHKVAPLVKGADSWVELKWSPLIPVRTKVALASMEVTAVDRFATMSREITQLTEHIRLSGSPEWIVKAVRMGVLFSPRWGNGGHNQADLLRAWGGSAGARDNTSAPAAAAMVFLNQVA